MTQSALTSPLARFDVAVVGGGPAGLAAALALASRGGRTALVVRGGPPPTDLRTAALFPASVRFLRDLGAWQACAGEAAPLAAIRLLDDTSWLLKAPETLFTASEVGQSELAMNITNTALTSALAAAAARCPSLAIFPVAGATSYTQVPDGVEIALPAGNRLLARLVVAADGRRSALRDFAAIPARTRELDQTALVTTFAHSRPHANASTEIHRDPGPLTTVPLPGNRSSLVWVERPREAARLAALGDADFLAELQHRLCGLLGTPAALTPRMTFPLHFLEVDCFARDRVALIGEAAHVLPPIGAQGLNLGLRDAVDLAAVVLPVLAGGGDPGTPEVLAAYDRLRAHDTQARSITIDLLNRSLESGTLALQLARGLGLFAMSLSPALKHAAMRHGAGALGLPPVMTRLAAILPPPPRRAAR